MKKTVAILLIALILLSVCGCAPNFPTVEDTFDQALCQGNNLSAEQGAYLLMRGENGGKANLMLYHKESGKAHILAESAAYKVGLLENKVYYRVLGENNLYCLDLETAQTKILQPDVLEYQVKGGFLYFIKNEPESCFYKTDLSTGMTISVKTDLTVNRLWITDYGVYYYNEETQLLQVIASDREQLIYKGEGETLSSLIGLGGADIAFLSMDHRSKKATVKTYRAATKTTTEYGTGSYTVLNRVGDRLVTADENKVYRMDPAGTALEEWFEVPDYDYIEIMSDCVVLYQGNQASIRYYK